MEIFKEWWGPISFTLAIMWASVIFVISTWLIGKETQRKLSAHLKAHEEASPVMTISACNLKGESCSTIVGLRLEQGEKKFTTLTEAIKKVDDRNEERHRILLTAILVLQRRNDNHMPNMRNDDSGGADTNS